MEPFIGQIQAFGFNFAPKNWALCNGQLMSIAQNSALFSLLGTTYGGDGIQTFALPDLRGRASLHYGQAPGLSNYEIGQASGTENVTLLTSEIPSHSHAAALSASSEPATTAIASGNILATSTIYVAADPDETLNPKSIMITPTGGNQPHENMQPYLAVNYCIALYGVYPSRG